MTETNRRQAMRRERWTRVVIVALLGVLGCGAVLHFFGSVAARAQSASGSTSASPAPTATAVPELPVLTPPPSPCAPQSPGACPTCTSDVPGASDYENSLPVPSPKPGFNYVVQLVNESNVTILAGADAAHQGSAVAGGPVPPPIAVLPREGTWVMQPKGAPDNGNILTIDIPAGWEATICPQTNPNCGALGPRFWPRTGCKYDIEHDLAQCETGNCGDAYDCGKQALRNPPQGSVAKTPTSIVEWTFNSQFAQGFVYPDISLVDGVTLTVDLQAIGLHCASQPGAPDSQFWLSQNQPLAVHGADLRDPGSCIPSFQLTRGEVGQLIQGEGNPDDVVACFTNCGRYEYPKTPDAHCDPSMDERCRNWLAFCCFVAPGDPQNPYGVSCTDDRQCGQSSGCWNDGSEPCTMDSDCPSGFSCVDKVCAKPFCACRAFIKNNDCPADVCTHPYSSDDRSSQPPFGRCSDVTDDPTACIGDDTVHAVFPGGYTWPNDPQTYVSDARAYRIIFAPGYVPGTDPAITDASPVPACESLPEAYGYATQKQACGPSAGLFAGAALSPTCTSDAQCPIIPGSVPPARFACDTATGRCANWACSIAPGGPASIGDILCSWPTAGATPSPTPGVGGPPATQTGGPNATRTPGTEDDGCAISPTNGSSSGGILLALVAAAGALLRSRRRRR